MANELDMNAAFAIVADWNKQKEKDDQRASVVQSMKEVSEAIWTLVHDWWALSNYDEATVEGLSWDDLGMDLESVGLLFARNAEILAEMWETVEK
jgi:hypothetical protein